MRSENYSNFSQHVILEFIILHLRIKIKNDDLQAGNTNFMFIVRQ